jgi:predicted  nucleic acid-binding Zn-ribbon protein
MAKKSRIDLLKIKKQEVMGNIFLYSKNAHFYVNQKMELERNKEEAYKQFGYSMGLAINSRLKELQPSIEYWNNKLIELYSELDNINGELEVLEDNRQRELEKAEKAKRYGNRNERRFRLIHEMLDNNTIVMMLN